jgi:hypothetical protein
MSTKTSLPPAGSSKTIATVAEHLKLDPEIAEYYLFVFFNEWGREKYLALVRFMIWCVENGKEESIAPTLAHDLFLKNENCSEPRSSTY